MNTAVIFRQYIAYSVPKLNDESIELYKYYTLVIFFTIFLSYFALILLHSVILLDFGHSSNNYQFFFSVKDSAVKI